MTRRVAVNTAIYLHGTSGSATATRAVVRGLRSLPETTVAEVAPRARGRHASVVNAVQDAVWDLWSAPRSTPGADLHVSPCNIGSRGTARRHALVVHDLMAIEHPEWFDRRFAAYFRLLVPPSIRRADRVLVPSQRVAASVRDSVPGADVAVVGWPHDGAASGLARWPAERPTVLVVGASEPVKNQPAAVAAVARLRADTGVDVRLRLLGPVGRFEDELRRAMRAADPDAAWTTREPDVPAETLAAAYRASWLLLQPSLDEGFGIPLVEAARHGLPCVHSGRGAMREIAPDGDAGGVDPELLADAMRLLLGRDEWSRRSAAAVEQAARRGPESFDRDLHRAVVDLLPEVS
jgi:glycosyltransferase involved in cell wall biosynthesis